MRRFAIAVLLVALFPWHAEANGNLSIRVAPGAMIPIGSSADLYAFSGTVMLAGEYQLPFLPWLYATTTAGYAFAQTTTATPLTLVPAAFGGGLKVQLLPRLRLATSVLGGYYIGMFQAAVGGNFYLTLVASVCLNVSPALSLGLGVSYDRYLAGVDPLFQGLGVGLQATYHIGSAPRPARIEVQPVEFPPVFPVLYTYYDDHPVGKARISNRERLPITDLSASFYVDQYMTKPKLSASTPVLEPGKSIELDFYALFTDEVLQLTEDTKVQATLLLEYTFAGNNFQMERVETILLHHRNAMTWDDDRKAAAFVTAKDPTVLRFAKSVAGAVRYSDQSAVSTNFRMGLGMYEALSLHGMSYVPDPTTPHVEFSGSEFALDYLAFPRQSLEYRAGDCDDLSILYAALLQAIGIDAAFITIPEHIYTAFSLELTPEVARKTFLRPEDLIYFDDRTWVPVEITLTESGFLKAWEVGAQQWRENVQMGTAAIYPVAEAWRLYGPVGIPSDSSTVQLPTSTELRARYATALDGFVRREIAPRVEKLQQTIRNSDNPSRQINKLGVLYARFGMLDKAKAEFERILSEQDYLPALLNLGNIHFLQEDLDQALEYYNQALHVAPDSGTALLAVARVNYERQDYRSAQQAYSRLSQIMPQLAERHSYLVIADRDGARAAEAVGQDVVWDEE